MKISTTAVLLVIGFIIAVDGQLQFKQDTANQISAILGNFAEVNELEPNTYQSKIDVALSCSDSEGNPGRITNVVDGTDFISISPRNQPFTYVYVNPLDAEVFRRDVNQQNEKKVSIRCENPANPRESVEFSAALVLQDVNDNVPLFERNVNESYSISIDEFLEPADLPLLIYTKTSGNPIIVTDEDGTDNNEVNAECVSMTIKGNSAAQPCDGYFSVESINEAFGRYYFNLYALKSDYSGAVSYTLEIRAINVPSEQGENTLYSISQNVVINIRDLQNLPPSIDQDSLTFQMREDLQTGQQLVGYISAFDQDTGDPHPIRFELTEPARIRDSDTYAFENDLFMLGQVSEDPERPNNYRVPILVKNVVDREAITDVTKTLYLGIKAIEYDPLDRPNREKGTAQATFSIKIFDVNDMTPVFSESVYYINFTELTSVEANPDNFRQISNNINIEVEDSDSADFNQFTVDIISGNNDGNFKLDRNEGSLIERFSLYAKQKILDYEVLPNSYTLQLRAVDKNQPTRVSQATISIIIIDANDHSPTFAENTATFNIKETDPVSTEIGNVIATDQDSGMFGTITEYVIIGDVSQTFSIDSQGTIRLQKAIDFETRDSYFFTVIAYDGGLGNNKREGSININVQVINVPDIGPAFVSTYTSTLREESLNLIPQIDVKAESREADIDLVEYFIESVSPSTIPQSVFSIDRITGKLNVLSFIDYKQTDPIRPGIVNVNISAVAGGLRAFTLATIRIIDINNFAPEFIPRMPDKTYYATITELARSGDNVIDLNVEDRDGNDTDNGRVTFQIVSGANDDFLITADSGIIKVTARANLDIEDNQERYTIVVLARDRGDAPRSASATVIVTLQDANNKDPVFENPLYRFQMNSDDPVGSTIGTVFATDADSDSRIQYSINFASVNFEKQSVLVQDFIDAQKVLRIDELTGAIKVAGSINREVYDRINLNVVVEDVNIDSTIQQRQTASASVVIFILAAVDPRLYFTNDGWTRDDKTIRVTFTESKATNYQIITLRAIDPEIPANVQKYNEVLGSDPNDYFEVDGPYVYIKKGLDYESLPADKEVTVTVEAVSDDNTKREEAKIILTVQDLNDNPPVFERPIYEFRVAEDKTAPYIVGRAKATDADSTSHGQVEYTLLGAQGDFAIYTERSGRETEAVIYVAENAELDFETKPFYNLVLAASDNPGATNTVKFVTNVDVEITIEDRNDMSPVFSESVYNISIVGTKEVGGDVFYIRAEDGDAGINGQVQYTIVDSTNDGNAYFGVDTVSQTSDIVGELLQVGRIYVLSTLENLPDRAKFELTISARDRGNPPTTPGYCKVIITVSKGVQDLKPKWDERQAARVEILEEQPIGTHVAKLLAYPADVTSSIKYSFLGSGDASLDFDNFNLDPDTGIITTKRVLDYDTDTPVYSLLVLATDSNNDTLTNQYLLIVQLVDINDNVPSFADCPGKEYRNPELARVNEDLPAGEFIYLAEACDKDGVPYNSVKYSWFVDNDQCTPDNLNVFQLDEDTGEVVTKITLDREDKDQYLLCIEASEPGIQNPERDIDALEDSKKILFVQVNVNDVNDLGPKFYVPAVKTVILQYPTATISVAEAYDNDYPPNNEIRYSIDNIDFTKRGKTQSAPTAFTINANDGTISAGTNDYTDYVDGYFDITVRAEDYNGANVPHDNQLQRVYVTDRASRIRVVFDRPADAGVDKLAKDMINELNEEYGDSDMYFEIETISYHVVSNNADPSFDKTDVCLVVVENDAVLTGVRATTRLTDTQNIQNILNDYGAIEPGSCDPAQSVYPVGWESYWWVLVAFAIFIFVCCLILILLICVLYRQYKQYMDSRRTYLVPE